MADLLPAVIARLKRLDLSNRIRCRKLGADAVVEKVDFVAVYTAQAGLCSICHKEMKPDLAPRHPDAMSVEHSPALSVCHEHSARTATLAHRSCNISKGQREDTTRAAGIKRVQKAEAQHALKLELKATDPEALERLKAASRTIRSATKIQSRGFQKLPPSSPSYAPRFKRTFSGNVVERT